jgi:hypothetical protein
MPKFLSERKRNLSVGISSYTENSTVLEVTGRVGIGTTYASADLTVTGDVLVSGALTASDINVSNGITVDGDAIVSGFITAKKYYGDGSTLSNVLSNKLADPTGNDARYVGFLTATSGIITSLSVDPLFVFSPSTNSVGIGTSFPLLDHRLSIIDDVKVTGFVTASEFYGDQVIGTPNGGFLPGAVGIETADYTKDSVNEINFILGKLVPKPPDTISNVVFTMTGLTGVGRLCAGFAPTNSTSGELTPSAGTQYDRNITNSVTSNYITEYGPGDAGTVTGYINDGSVGVVTLTTGSNDGIYGALQISNDKDAFFSTRNPGINSEFYEVYDARLINATSPNGFNRGYIQQFGYKTQRAFWYEDPSTVSAPVLSATTPVTPPSPTLNYSSGVPHYTQSSSNAFTYVITCENASGDMYTQNTFLASSGQTTGFQNGGTKSYADFDGGTNPPVQNYGVGTGVTCLVSQAPRDLHQTVNTDATRFSNYTATTPYGSNSVRATITQAVNMMGTTARTNKIDEDNILVSSLGTGSGNAKRVNAGSTGDNPSPVFTTFTASNTAATYESIVRGAVLRHDVTDYSNGSWLPVGPDYSSGRTGAQYFQMDFIRSQVSEFKIVVTGSYAGCWVCMPNNSTWTSSLSGTNGWADMFQAYRGAGVPTSAEPGCSSGGAMNGNSGTFTCVFGTESSSNDSNNRILIRWRLNSGQSITAMSFTST